MVSNFYQKIYKRVFAFKYKTRSVEFTFHSFLGVVLQAGMDDVVSILYIISEKNRNQTTGSVDGLVFAKVSHGN